MGGEAVFLNLSLAAQSVLIFGLVIALGLLLGSVKFFGVHFGIAGVFFAGLLIGQFQLTVDPNVLEFAREFGLILFVYAIGIQVGPGFFSSFRRYGFLQNALAVSIVLMGVLMSLAMVWIAGIPLPVALGLFSGGTTNTPSLAAAEQTLKEITHAPADILMMPGYGYAVSYPMGVLGIILTMVFIRRAFRVDLKKEQAELEREHSHGRKISRLNIQVENENLHGVQVRQIPALNETGVTISRIYHEGRVEVALPGSKVYLRDVILAVGAQESLERMRMIVGSIAAMDLAEIESDVSAERVIVTKHGAMGLSLDEDEIMNRYAVRITRVIRSGIELIPARNLKIQFGDALLAVGNSDRIKKFSEDMGNSKRDLEHPQLIPLFLGISLGVLAGSLPLHLPGVPAPVKLGLAGGPLMVAMLLSRIGNVGPLTWFLPSGVNEMLREFGVALFLACVGLRAGGSFLETLLKGDGFYWMACAVLITLVPLWLIAWIARYRYQMNYLTLCGLLAGSMTNPPGLAFANQMTSTHEPSISYANVYPMVMMLKIICVQLMIIFSQHL